MNLILTTSALTVGTVTMSDTGQDIQVVHDAGVTATLTLAFPANPINGQKVGCMSVGGITALTLTTTVGSIINAITTLAAGITATYIYSSSATKWYKIG